MTPHMAVAVVLVAIGLAVIVGVTAYEFRAGRHKWREFEEWDRLREARRVTGPRP